MLSGWPLVIGPVSARSRSQCPFLKPNTSTKQEITTPYKSTFGCKRSPTKDRCEELLLGRSASRVGRVDGWAIGDITRKQFQHSHFHMTCVITVTSDRIVTFSDWRFHMGLSWPLENQNIYFLMPQTHIQQCRIFRLLGRPNHSHTSPNIPLLPCMTWT